MSESKAGVMTPSIDAALVELQKERELLTLLGDPRVRVSVLTDEQRPEAETGETSQQPPVSRRYQVG